MEDDLNSVGDGTLGAELERSLSVTGGLSLCEDLDASFWRGGGTRSLLEAFSRRPAARVGDSISYASWDRSFVVRCLFLN